MADCSHAHTKWHKPDGSPIDGTGEEVLVCTGCKATVMRWDVATASEIKG